MAYQSEAALEQQFIDVTNAALFVWYIEARKPEFRTLLKTVT